MEGEGECDANPIGKKKGGMKNENSSMV